MEWETQQKKPNTQLLKTFPEKQKTWDGIEHALDIDEGRTDFHCGLTSEAGSSSGPLEAATMAMAVQRVQTTFETKTCKMLPGIPANHRPTSHPCVSMRFSNKTL